jgi:hypothetical protein
MALLKHTVPICEREYGPVVTNVAQLAVDEQQRHLSDTQAFRLVDPLRSE